MGAVAMRTLSRSVRDWIRSGMPEPDDRYTRQARRAWGGAAGGAGRRRAGLRSAAAGRGRGRSVAGGGPAERGPWIGCSRALSAEDIALGYQQLLHVERGGRDLTAHLELRPRPTTAANTASAPTCSSVGWPCCWCASSGPVSA